MQDYPGPPRYWHVGVPPSGPMDFARFPRRQRLVGNAESAAGLEIAVTGPTLRFSPRTLDRPHRRRLRARTRRRCPFRYGGGHGIARARCFDDRRAFEGGARAYLAVARRHRRPRRTSAAGAPSSSAIRRACRAEFCATGDVLHFGAAPASRHPSSPTRPSTRHEWDIGVLYGPHGAPDFFTPADIETFFATAWKVHYNSDRTGMRLIGPKPQWARKDGGEAGLHPSNIHDNAYAIGTVDFTGDMPMILGPDGPSLGGFVCPATIVARPNYGKSASSAPATRSASAPSQSTQALEHDQRSTSTPAVRPTHRHCRRQTRRKTPVLRTRAGVVCRADGDRYLLVEYGPNVLDLNLRFRVHALRSSCAAPATAGHRRHHARRPIAAHPLRHRRLSTAKLCSTRCDACETRIPDLDDIAVPSRIVHLPLSWDDPATQLAIRKYMQSVRPDAPWCPQQHRVHPPHQRPRLDRGRHRIVFDASYLVLGLGDVYLGAPVATPLDPRHRLVTTKYNPARTWTPENAVGIGGAYLCVYGMEGPGGYQFVGRTLQMWNTFLTTPDSSLPWLLRFFDQIRFYPVSAARTAGDPRRLPSRRLSVCASRSRSFGIREYHAFLRLDRARMPRDFKRRQQAAFEAERERWALNGQAAYLAARASHSRNEHRTRSRKAAGRCILP